MMLLSRVNRLEQRHTSGNPFEALTDDELEAAIASVRARIEASTGMSETSLADTLIVQLRSGNLPADLDEQTASVFVRAIKGGLHAQFTLREAG